MIPQPQSVLVVDDEPGMRAALSANFQRVGWRVETAGGASEAVCKFNQHRCPLVVTDIRMPDGDGLQVMRAVRQTAPSTAVILLTAFGSVPEAVQAVQSGAADYLIKPFSFDQLKSAVERVLSTRPAPAAPDGDFRSRLVGESSALLRALERASAAARTDADVLIEAESGTGKELLARYLHENSSRRSRPFVAINCAAVPEQLLESELFGHTRGAFTGAVATKPGKFELAANGTLLLDEVGEMPLALQPKLLRVLQEREFERVGETRTIKLAARLITTTNVSLRAMVETGKFRADLFFRLNVIPLGLPPLRERHEDIAILAEHFARQIALQSGRALPHLSPDFLARLYEHRWPGNVRELQNLMRRLLALHPAGDLDGACLDEECFSSIAPALSAVATPGAGVLVPGTPIRALERQLLERTLLETGGNRTHTAELLGISVRTIRNKIREYGLPPRRYA